jgi:DNA polymerase-1
MAAARSRTQSTHTPSSRTPGSAIGAKLPPPGDKDVLYIVDLPNYVFRAYHAITPLSSSKGEPTHAVHGTVNMILKIISERKPDMFAVALDSLTPNFRRAIDKDYKAHRPPPPPDLGKQMMWCEKIVEAFNIPIYRVDGLEADDVIAALVSRAERENMRVVIVSVDKDMMQLVHDDDENVVLWDTMRNIVYGPEQVKDKLGVKPSQVRDFLALTGDTSDNIPGVPSVGQKTAADLLREFGSLDAIYRNLDRVKRDKLRETLRNHEADARLSQKLVTLARDAVIPWDPGHLRHGGMKIAELRRIFTELELTRPLSLLPPLPPIVRTYELVARREALEAAAARAKERRLLCIDVLGSSDDPMRSDVIGLALSTAPGEGVYVPVGHRSLLTVSGQLSMKDVREVLGPILADPGVRKVGCDLKRVEVLFAQHEMSLAEPTWDVAIASYLLDPEAKFTVDEIARRELDITLPKLPDKIAELEALEVDKVRDIAGARAEAICTLAGKLEPKLAKEKLARLMNEVELPLARVLAKMEMFGVLVDCDVLAKLSREADVELKRLEEQAKQVAGRDFAIRSRDQLETILFDELKLPVRKRTPKGGRSTDAEVLEELDHPLTRVILLHREVDKLKGTYLDALPRYVNPKTGRIHTRFAQTVAATGRLSSLDPNLQNIPVRTHLGRAVREAFVAPKGHALISADYSQIELRILAHLSKDPVLLETYRRGEDVHARTASVIFDVPIDQVTADQRRAAKTINFGVMYGMGEPALARQLDISRDQAARFIESYFRRYEGVARFMQQTIDHARAGHPVLTMFGRRRFLPNLRSQNRGLRFEAERIAKNTPIQGTAADILKMAMVKLGQGEVVPGATMVLTVHDELLFEVPQPRVEEAKKRIKEAMETIVTLDVPLVVDIGAGPNWASAK